MKTYSKNNQDKILNQPQKKLERLSNRRCQLSDMATDAYCVKNYNQFFGYMYEIRDNDRARVRIQKKIDRGNNETD